MNLLKLFKRKEVYVCPDWGQRKPLVFETPFFFGVTKEARKLIKEKPFKRSKLK